MTKSLTDLFQQIGAENLEYQILAQVLTDAGQTEDGYTELTFVTDQLTIAQMQAGVVDKVGFVVWADREATEKALNELGIGKPVAEASTSATDVEDEG